MSAAFSREGGYGAPASVIGVDSSHSDYAILVPDAQLLFTAEFHRAGPDLVLIGRDGERHLIPGYFSGEHERALVAPNGASLASNVVDLLAGSPTPGEYAQSQPTPPSDPVGRVEKVVGTVTVVRNGVSVALNVGDAIYKSDVVQTAANSSVGIAFPDGTALNLVANTRMALTEYSYDLGSTSNSALFNLVEGGLSFVAGKVAHTGNMNIGTPVAVVGIRGTAGWLYEDQVANVTATAGNVTLHFAAVYDQVTNTESTYTLYAVDANGQLLHDPNGNLVALATVSSTQNGIVTTLTGNGIGALPTVATAPPDLTQQQFGQIVVPQVINMAIQAIQQFQQQQNNQQNNNPNPQSNPSSPGSTTPPTNQDNGSQPSNGNSNNPLPLTQNITVPTTNNAPVNVAVTVTPTQQIVTPPTVTGPTGPTTDVWNPSSGNPASGDPWDAAQNWSPTPPGPADNAQDNSTVPAVINDSETVQNLTVGLGATISVVSNTDPSVTSSLNVAGTADIAGTVKADLTVSDPSITFNNGLIVETGGQVEADGSAASIFITGSTGVANSGTIIADDGGTIVFSNVSVTDGSTGLIESIDPNSLVTLSHAYIAGGTLETGNLSSSVDGLIEVGAGVGSNLTVFDGSANAVTIDAYVQVDDGVSLELIGTIHNPGTIVLGSESGADLVVSGPVTIDGEGEVLLSGNASVITGAGTPTDALVNDGNTISGSGTIEDLAITNQSGGALDLNGPSTLDNVTISGGQITVGSGATAVLDNVVLDNVALTVNSDGTTPSIQIDAGDTLTWAGASAFEPGTAGGVSIIDNNGQIIHTGTLQLGFSTSTFEGTGTDTENGGNTGVPSTLINEGNTFDGYGQQGSGNPGSLTIINQAAGTFDADVAGHAYIWDAGASTITNQGVVEATNGGTFEIESTVAGDTTVVTNTGAGSVAAGAGSEVLLSNATIDGGTISIAATGELVATGVSTIDNAIIDNSGSLETGGTFTLDDDTVDGGVITGAASGNNNVINVDAADTLTLNGATAQGNTDGTGTADNSGTITLENTLTLAGTGFTLLLDDAGTVSLNGATITGSNTGEMLDNNANTISGAGQIGNGNGDLTLQNDAGAQITAQGGALTIDSGVINNGTMTAESGATVILNGTVSGTGSTVVDAGGTVVVGGLDQQATTFEGIGTLQITTTGNLTGAIDGLVQGDIIDFAGNTTITATSISGSILTVNESSGGPLTYTIGGATSGEYFAVQSDGNSGTELLLSPASAPTVTALTDVTSTGTTELDAGKTITFTVDTSEAVNAVGSALTLSNGATAAYTSGSGSETLTFSYTVAAGDASTADLKVTGYSGTIADAAGNALAAASVTEDTGVAIITSAPTVTALTDVTSTGTTELDAGKTITFTVDTSEAVNAVGSALTLSNGATAAYTSGSGSETLTFSYTVAAGDASTADLKVTGYSGTIADAAGNALAAASVTEDTGVAIITSAPTVTALTDVTSTGTTELDAGKTITFTVDTSEAVNAVGSALTLSNGATAAYTSGSGSETLTFSYTVAAGDASTADLKVTGYSGTIADAAGNALAAASVTEDTGVAIITSAPTVTALTDVTSTGTTELDAGKTITFTVDTSEAVNAVGSALTLSNGATAAYTSGSGSETLTFSYTVAAGDASTADLKVTGYSGTIADAAGNALAAASVTEDTGVAIITSAPTVTALTDVTSTGTTELDAGKTITFTVDTSEAVNAVGSALTLSNGATAAYTSGSGSETLTFSYTVAAGDASTADLKVTGYSGTIADAAGNALAAASVTEDTGVAIITSAPTVTALTDVTSTGTTELDAGKTITFTVDTSEAVNAVGSALTLSNGATAAYTSGSGSETLTFSYTVAAGDASTADLKVTGYSGTIADAAGNALAAASVTEDTGVAIITSAPTVTALTDVTSTGTTELDAGKTITFTVDTSEAVNAVGSALTLSNGATAAYTSGSGSETLTFSYTVAAGDASTADLKVTGYSGTIADAAGNALAAASVTEDTGVAIITSAPTVTALTDVTSTGTTELDAGKTITFTVDTSEAVNAVGSALTLSNGATAAYTSGSGSETLTFSYTVAAGDASTADLKVTGYSGTIADAAGNALAAASVTEDTGVAIITSAPTVTALTDVTSTGTTELDAGKTITFTVDTSEAVNAVGSALTLSNGATAAYTSGSGSETLTFSYTVAAGDASTADLKVTGYSGTIADAAGNALAAASVTEDTGVAIITSAPTVTALTDVTSTGTTELDAGKTITFTVDTSEAVNAVGSALTLSNGATAAYTSGSGSETLTFSYTVAAGDASTADLKVTGYSGTIADAAGNALAAASVTEDTGVAIITSAPTVTALTDVTSTGTTELDAGKTITFTVDTSEAVNAVGSALTLSNGATAAYTSGSGSETLTFSYTVAAGDASTADLKVTGYSGTIADAAGNALAAASVTEDTGVAIITSAPTVTALTDVTSTGTTELDAGKTITFTVDTSEAVNAVGSALTLSNGATAAYTSGSGSETLTFSYTVAAGDASTADLKVTGYSGTIADAAGNALAAASVTEDTGVAIITSAPTVTALTDVTSTGTTELDAGKTITFTVDTSEAVNAVGSALTLSNGATAAYTSGSGSETLTFSYTVAAGDASTADLKVTGYSGTIADAAGNALAAASVTEDTGVAIITSAPTVTALTDVTSTGTTELDAGKTITFTVDTSEAVNAVGSALTLSNGATAAYTSGSGSETLTFSYTVAAGDASTADLKVTGYSGTIADAAGNALAAASVTEDTGVAIITSAPTVTALTDVTSTGTTELDAGKTITFTVDTSEAVNAVGSALTLSNGATAAYTSGSGSETLTFSYTVAAGDASTADLKVTGYSGTIADAAGNALAAASVTEDTGVAIITSAPTVTALTDVTSTGTTELDAGKTITFTVDTSEAVNAVGSALTLSNGATAAYTSGSGSETLTFSYTVAAGDASTADLKVTGYSGTIADAAGNALAAASVTEDTGVAIITSAPTVTALTDVTSTGTTELDAGKTITFTVDTSEAVNAVGSALTLSNGATAAYTSGSGSETLTFSYTVAAGDASTADLKVTGYSGTIADAAGNALAAASVTEDTGVAIITSAPTVTALTDVTSTGTTELDAGKTITFTVDTSEAVNAVGSALTLSNGATAAYTSGSGSETLTFSYTVAAGDASTADLKVTGYSGTIADAAGNALAAASVTEDTGVAIITSAPTVTALTDVTSTGTTELDAGKTITFTVDTSEAVNAVGSALTLSNGATAAYTSGSGSETLTFSYTVAAGDASTADLKVTGYSGTIADAAGNALAAASVTEDTGVAIITSAPTVTALTDVTSTGTTELDAGKTITFTVDTSEAVNAVGSALTLSNGATAAYTSGSGSETLTFSYTVAAGDASTADLKVTGYSGTIADAAGNALAAASVTEDTGVAIITSAQNDEWLNTSGGTWTDSTDAATNWSDGALPRAIDNVLIDLAGSGPYTVTIPNGATADADSLTLSNANATLDVAGTLTIADALTIDAGRLVVEAGNDITVGTTVTNAGTLELATSAELPSITNTGGTIQIDAGDTLTLQGGTITGGAISITATGELVATGTSAIDNAIIDNSGALETGGTFTLDGDTVDGGIITGAGGGGGNNIINVDATDTLTLNGVTAQGNTDGTGTVDNSGTILLENTLTLAGTGVTLLFDETGTVSLNGATIAGSNTGETLENNANTISGAGQIGNGNGDLSVQNDADGNITAQDGTLTIDAGVINNGTMTAESDATLSLNGTVSGNGSTVVDAGGTVVVNALDQQAITYDGVGTLQITPAGNLTGAINGLVQGDVIDFTNNTSITSTSISGTTLTVNELIGGPLTYTIGGTISGDYFAVQSDGNSGTELVLDPATATAAVSVVGNDTVQAGQILVAQATINGDATDQAASVSYQWEFSDNGGLTWSAPVASTTTGQFNGVLSGFYQLTQAEEGDLVRAVASFTGDTGQVTTGTSAATGAVADITPILTVPFNYDVDSFTIVDGSATFDDTFSSGPPPVGGLFGTKLAAFATSAGGGGSVWTEVNGMAVMSSSGAAANGINNSVQALLITNTDPEGTGTGESNSGLKENATFTVSATFQLVAPAPSTGYGIDLTNGVPGSGATEEVQLQVELDAIGGRHRRSPPIGSGDRYIHRDRKSGPYRVPVNERHPDPTRAGTYGRQRKRCWLVCTWE